MIARAYQSNVTYSLSENNNIQANSYVGGLAGSLESTSNIQNCYAKDNNITATASNIGGLIGYKSGSNPKITSTYNNSLGTYMADMSAEVNSLVESKFAYAQDNNMIIESDTVSSGLCIKCPRGATTGADGYSCVCPQNDKHTAWNPETNKCDACESGYYNEKGKCISEIACPTGTVRDDENNTCVCQNAEMTYDIKTNSCICPYGATLIDGACVCPNPANSVDNECGCSFSQIKNGDNCEECPANMVANHKHTKCVCKEGTYKAKDGTCQPCVIGTTSFVDSNYCIALDENMRWDKKSNSCMCKDLSIGRVDEMPHYYTFYSESNAQNQLIAYYDTAYTVKNGQAVYDACVASANEYCNSFEQSANLACIECKNSNDDTSAPCIQFASVPNMESCPIEQDRINSCITDYGCPKNTYEQVSKQTGVKYIVIDNEFAD